MLSMSEYAQEVQQRNSEQEETAGASAARVENESSDNSIIPYEPPKVKTTTKNGIITPAEPANPKKHLICMADIKPKEIQWLWHPYIPQGKITLLRGDPGGGKTTFCLSIAAIVSNGWAFPAESGFSATEAGNVLFVTAEDDLEDTVAPRLIKAGADVAKVFSYMESSHEQLTFTSSTFEGLLKESQPKLVVIDPIQAFLGGNVDGHKANEIRPIMSHLRALAEKYNCAILIIEHLNKNAGGKSLYRGLGSIDVTAAARSILMLGADPDNENERGIAHIKSNCGEIGGVVGFSIGREGLTWNPHTHVTAAMIQGYAKPANNSGDSALDDAKEFLQEVLGQGRQSVRDITITAKQSCISDITLRRAREELGILFEREGFGKSSVTYWKLPHSDSPFQNIETLTPDGQCEIASIFDAT